MPQCCGQNCTGLLSGAGHRALSREHCPVWHKLPRPITSSRGIREEPGCEDTQILLQPPHGAQGTCRKETLPAQRPALMPTRDGKAGAQVGAPQGGCLGLTVPATMPGFFLFVFFGFFLWSQLTIFSFPSICPWINHVTNSLTGLGEGDVK